MPILFADDTDLFCTGTDLKDMIRQINEEMVKIYAWVYANKLSLNIDKTNFMLFMPKKNSHCTDHVVINQSRIQEVKEKNPWCHHRQQAKVVCTHYVHQQKDLQRHWYHIEV